MTTAHRTITGADLHTIGYVQSSDPGAVGANICWVDTSSGPPFALKKRNAANTAWEAIGGGGGVTDHGALTGLADDDHPQYLTAAEGNAAYQPLDADLTSIAALATTAFGRSVLTQADAAALRTLQALAAIAASGSASDLIAGSIPAARIPNSLITYAMLQNVAADRILGRLASSGVVSELTAAQLNTLLAQQSTIEFVIDGGGAVITTGVKGDLQIDFAATITKWTLLGDQSGSIVVDIWKDTYANFPPTIADVITASAKPTISSAVKGQSSTLTGWTTAIAAGDILRFNVNSVTTLTRCTLALTIVRT